MNYIASMTVYERVSADYDVVKRTRTKSFSEVMSVGEIMQWAESQKQSMMGASDVTITTDEP